MKKLHLDGLAVESFATTAPLATRRGTVAARSLPELRTASGCPDSWDGTCYVTCWETCGEFCGGY